MSEVTSTQTASGSNSPYEITPEFDVDPQSPQEPEAHTLELNLENAERLMPQPTTKAPWFGYDSFADYGDEGLNAVAEADDRAGSGWDNGDAPEPSGNAMGDIIFKPTVTIVTGDNPEIVEDNDIVDAKNTTVNVDRANAKSEGGGNARSAASSGASGSGAKAGSGKTGAKK